MKKTAILLFLLFYNLSHGCTFADGQRNKEGTKDCTQKKDVLIGYENLKLISPLTRVNRIDEEPEHQRKFFTECYDWSFKEEYAYKILENMRQVEGSYAYHICQYYPCWYTGKVSNGIVEFEITIYAHSSITLSNEKETLFFILEEESDLFIVPCGYYDE